MTEAHSDSGTGLRQHPRDRELPAWLGQPELSPPDDALLSALVQEHLVGADGPRVLAVDWEFARWKPGVSLTTAHRVTLSDGSAVPVATKRYRGGKLTHLAAREDPAPDGAARDGWRAERALVMEQSLALWTPEGDRALELAPLLSGRRVSAVFREAGLLEAELVRKRRTRFELLRYKPERRAVLRVDLELRDATRSRHSLAYRVLPKAHATALLATRRSFEAAGGGALAPRLAGGHGPYGLLAEPWLTLSPGRSRGFGEARRVGRLLGRLHDLPVPAGALPHLPPPISSLLSLLPGQPLESLSWPQDPTPLAWLHGDLHPDQWADSDDGELLLDLDALTLGDPGLDLASWIADHLAERPGDSWTQASGALLDGYAEGGGQRPAPRHLARLVACELVRRAAGVMRRLERGALERSALIVERARSLVRRD